jgi:hypothetical protein
MEILVAIFQAIMHFIAINWPYFAGAMVLITAFAFIASDSKRENERNNADY